jgi:ribosome biogenesis GTPase
LTGIVTKSTGSWYTVRLPDGSFLEARIKGRFRADKINTTNPVAVGDEVTMEDDLEEGTAIITEIGDRRNYIIRQSPKKKALRHIVAANLDQAMLIITLTEPRTSLGFINRFLVVAEAYDIPVILVFNKVDLFGKSEMARLNEVSKMYGDIGYDHLTISALQGENLDPLHGKLKNKTTLLSGHSGVGKTTLINALTGVERKTDEISRVTGKGKHATTFAEMLDLPFGGFIIDTPGIKEFGIVDVYPEELSEFFPEMKAVREGCKFKDCKHVAEPGCAVAEAIEVGGISETRHRSYLSILDDLEQLNRWEI